MPNPASLGFLLIEALTGLACIALGCALIHSHGGAARWVSGYALLDDEERRRIDAHRLTSFIGRTALCAGGTLIATGLLLSLTNHAGWQMLAWASFAVVLVVRIVQTRWDRFYVDR